MKTVLYLIITLLLLSCSATPEKKWDAATASRSCFDAATKDKYGLTDTQLKSVTEICDCVGKKIVVQFKNEEEANNKMTDAAVIANECRDWWKSNHQNQ
jgi:hypothetical protein